MSKDTTVSVRVDLELKDDVENILNKIGLTTSQAITIFFKTIKREQGIPLAVKKS